jgi:Na+/H+ antiporter NhaD/arsenite permease-like protein
MIILLIVFILGYCAIACENIIKINKSAIALITGVSCWCIYMFSAPSSQAAGHTLMKHLADISGILFFLIGAMTIVQIIDMYDGFEILSDMIQVKSKSAALLIISAMTFCLSAVLDNLTTTIVMISTVSRLIKERKDQLLFSGIIIIAANAGGAWSPIGDVTTTMLWIGGRISAYGIIRETIFPSLICLIVPVAIMSFKIRGNINNCKEKKIRSKRGILILVTGLAALLFVPVFKTITHLPPFMGILCGLGIMWIITERIQIHGNHTNVNKNSMAGILQKIDLPSVLFFLGILLSVAALEAAGQLAILASGLNHVGNQDVIVMITGLLSSIVDNVPLVAASMGMYDISQYAMDNRFWTLLSYCAGTGGSALVIGSAAGVTAMGMTKIDFFWYIKKITPLALAGYLSGFFFFFFVN